MYTSQSEARPSLSLLTSGGSATVYWLVPSTSFALEQSTCLTGPSWVPVPIQPSLSLTSLQNQVTLPMISNCFFRLTKP